MCPLCWRVVRARCGEVFERWPPASGPSCRSSCSGPLPTSAGSADVDQGTARPRDGEAELPAGGRLDDGRALCVPADRDMAFHWGGVASVVSSVGTQQTRLGVRQGSRICGHRADGRQP